MLGCLVSWCVVLICGRLVHGLVAIACCWLASCVAVAVVAVVVVVVVAVAAVVVILLLVFLFLFLLALACCCLLAHSLSLPS